MRSKLSRHLVPVTLAAAILIAPLPAAAASRDFGSMFESTWGSLVGWAGDILRHLWAEEGASLDPLGRPESVPVATPEGGRYLWAEEGASCDPLGRPACASGMTLEDSRQ